MADWREKCAKLPSVKELDNEGVGKQAAIIATGWSYLDHDYSEDMVYFEINKMRVARNIDYSVYYDYVWKNYFNENEIKDYRKLIAFGVHVSDKVDYWYDTHMVMFNDSGFHALYIASEIMRFDEVYLYGYDYYKVYDKWHPYEDDYLTEDVKKKKDICLQGNINKYSEIDWYSKIYNCNERSALKAFPFINKN
jgi:hypothetical protein